jgi:hypothetical protein
MIIECPYCEAKVDGREIGDHTSCDEENPYPFKTILLECPICRSALVGCQELIQTGPNTEEWIPGQRLWPRPESYISRLIPEIVRISLEEANKCFKAKAYTACAVMSGCALEGICQHFQTKSKTLARGLEELLERGILEKRLSEWGKILREQRNLGAHASDEKISREDAQDLLDFVNAICDYVFVLSDKYDKFVERKSKMPKPDFKEEEHI